MAARIGAPPASAGDEQDSGTCPLCLQANRCAVAGSGDASRPCWCESVVVAPELRARAATSGGARRCICADCVRSAGIGNAGKPDGS
jgi:hypothetical protein